MSPSGPAPRSHTSSEAPALALSPRSDPAAALRLPPPTPVALRSVCGPRNRTDASTSAASHSSGGAVPALVSKPRSLAVGPARGLAHTLAL